MCVYAIVHDATQRHYIGATNDLKIRWRAHRGALNKGKHDNALLQVDWLKYGGDAFTLKVLEVVSEESALCAAESRWHDALSLRYNVKTPAPTWYARPNKRPAMGIYAWVHTPTGARYVGSSGNLNKRRAQHVNALNQGRHPSDALQVLWDRDGQQAFRFSVLEEVRDKSKLLAREQEWLDSSANALNSAPLAGSVKGMKKPHRVREGMRTLMRRYLATPKGQQHWAALQAGRDETTFRKIGESNKRRWQDPEARQRMIEANKRRFDDPAFRQANAERVRSYFASPEGLEARRKMSEARKGKGPSPEVTAKARAANLGRKHTPETRERMRLAALAREQRKREARMAQESPQA